MINRDIGAKGKI